MEGTNMTRKKSYYPYEYDQISSEFFFLLPPILVWASLVAQMVKNPSAMLETRFDLWGGMILWRRA